MSRMTLFVHIQEAKVPLKDTKLMHCIVSERRWTRKLVPLIYL